MPFKRTDVLFEARIVCDLTTVLSVEFLKIQCTFGYKHGALAHFELIFEDKLGNQET